MYMNDFSCTLLYGGGGRGGGEHLARSLLSVLDPRLLVTLNSEHEIDRYGGLCAGLDQVVRRFFRREKREVSLAELREKGDRQREWLTRTLQQSTADWLLVAGHYPVGICICIFRGT